MFNNIIRKFIILLKYIMPTKLIRLTSDSGDGVFSGLFNQEIEIKENSEIALQSLSVERKSQEILINGGNNEIDFNSVASSSQNAVISPQPKI